jgi:hypothetical protein
MKPGFPKSHLVIVLVLLLLLLSMALFSFLPFSSATGPSISLKPTSGPYGTKISVSGTGFVPSTQYSLCFSSSSTTCPAYNPPYSEYVDTNSSGDIPAGTSVTVPPYTSAGLYYVIVQYYSCGGSPPCASAPFKVKGPIVTSSEAGYVVEGASGSVKSVTGSWKVSTGCAANFLVGIDVYPSWYFFAKANEVGTSGCTAYYIYPGSDLQDLGTVKAGDVMKGSVSYSNGIFQFKLEDMTTKTTFSISPRSETGTTRSNAGWILGTVNVAQPNFGTIQSGSKYTLISGTDTASIGTHTGSIGSFSGIKADKVLELLMNDPYGGVAIPSALKSSGTSFTLTWS